MSEEYKILFFAIRNNFSEIDTETQDVLMKILCKEMRRLLRENKYLKKKVKEIEGKIKYVKNIKRKEGLEYDKRLCSL